MLNSRIFKYGFTELLVLAYGDVYKLFDFSLTQIANIEHYWTKIVSKEGLKSGIPPEKVCAKHGNNPLSGEKESEMNHV